MEETTLDVYEAYFKNKNNWFFSLKDLSSHKCLFCTGKKFKITFDYKQDATDLIICYLNHLKIYGGCWKKVKYFIESIRMSNFCNDTTGGKCWVMSYWFEKDTYILSSF